ncbi:MAG: peptidoglycan DD-metalloendopeptidase family protein [Rhodobacteraceae bacterium]|nr:peptidoglycan DD-metalloendopeptidase family protein [Paracoccaceae bacterium]
MITQFRRIRPYAYLIGATALLAACEGQPLDYDLRGLSGGFSTTQAATSVVADRPRPDDRGVISYPNFQVAVAERGDTLGDVAARVDLPVEELARYNGIPADAPLRSGEVVALPRRVAEPSPSTGAIGTGPILPAEVDVTTLAGNAIDSAPATPARAPEPTSRPADAQTGEEPIRHQVERGETAYTIARLYQVPVKSLAEWNGLGPDFAIRDGQFLLIPVARSAPPPRIDTENTTAPGAGSPTPEPPSAAKPLPDDPTAKPLTEAEKEKPATDVGKTTKPAASSSKLALPVQGKIIREYSKNRNEGIDIQAPAGTAITAAADGTVAAITRSADGIPIIVVRHADNLLTVYANTADVIVEKGDKVRRGQALARIRSGNSNYLHFEVREGFDSVDPGEYLG